MAPGSLINLVCLWQAGYTARKFLYEAHLQEETSCNSNAWQSEWGFAVCVTKRLYEQNAICW